jgi:hypothetical protein
MKATAAVATHGSPVKRALAMKACQPTLVKYAETAAFKPLSGILPNLLLNRYTAAENPKAEIPTATKTADGSTPNKRKITLSIAVKMMRRGIYLLKDTSSVDEPSPCWKIRRKDISGTCLTTLLLMNFTTGEHRNFSTLSYLFMQSLQDTWLGGARRKLLRQVPRST